MFSVSIKYCCKRKNLCISGLFWATFGEILTRDLSHQAINSWGSPFIGRCVFFLLLGVWLWLLVTGKVYFLLLQFRGRLIYYWYVYSLTKLSIIRNLRNRYFHFIEAWVKNSLLSILLLSSQEFHFNSIQESKWTFLWEEVPEVVGIGMCWCFVIPEIRRHERKPCEASLGDSLIKYTHKLKMNLEIYFKIVISSLKNTLLLK